MSADAIAIERRQVASSVRRPPLAGAGVLSMATVGSGVLAYAFLVLAARTLGPADYGRIGVLWAAMFIAVVVLFRPLEQTTTRAVADRLARGAEIRTVVRSVAGLYIAIVAVVVVTAYWTWAPLRDHLFLGSGLLTTSLFVGALAYGLEYVLRGILAGGRWFRGYALCLMADSITRVAVAIPLVVIASRDLAALAVAAAGLGGFVAPLYVGRRWLRDVASAGGGSRFELGSALTFAGPASMIAAADQILVNGGPLLVILAGGAGASKAAGVVFAATMLVRIPVYVFQGVAASLLPNLTHLQALDHTSGFRHTLRRAALVLTLVTAAIGVTAAAGGPRAMGIVYGSGFAASRTPLTLLGVGVGLYLAAATASQALLALDRGLSAAVSWMLAACVFLSLYVVVPGDQLSRIAVSFAAALLLCAVLLSISVVRALARR